ncbi:hypothetical protein EZV77_03270 [Burkholderia thailandensis]|nr:hypothetical protein EZV77_03270 [Burkholderia thailandensis]
MVSPAVGAQYIETARNCRREAPLSRACGAPAIGSRGERPFSTIGGQRAKRTAASPAPDDPAIG